jgi:hypothetical protein
MTVPEVTLFADGHYRRAIYGLGPYIADYPEQVLLACVVQGWCPRFACHFIVCPYLIFDFADVRHAETTSMAKAAAELKTIQKCYSTCLTTAQFGTNTVDLSVT